MLGMNPPIRYLVTGASGFIGPYLVDRILSEGHFCRCLVRDPRKIELSQSDRLEIVKADVTRPETLKGVADGIDRVLHLATLGHMKNFTVSQDMFFKVNVQGTVNVMKEALRAGVKRVVHCSSTAAMGICTEVPSDENTFCKPHHYYGKSKLAAEKEVKRMVADNHLPAIIIRFSLVYGPGEPRDMLKLTKLAKKGLLPKIGNKPKLTPLIHISDAVKGLLLAAERGRVGEVYLITNPRPEPFDKIADILKDELRISKPTLYLPECIALAIASVTEKMFTFLGKNPPVSKKNIESTLADRVFSIEKAKKELGFDTEIDPVIGLREMVAWYSNMGLV